MKRIISVTLLAIFGTTLLAGCASEVANCTSDQKSETHGQYEILICGYGRKYASMLQAFHKNTIDLLIPEYKNEPASLTNDKGLPPISFFTKELYNLPWIWYRCSIGHENYYVKITYPSVLSLMLPENAQTYLEVISALFPNSPMPNNYEKFESYSAVYEKELTIADKKITSLVLELNNCLLMTFSVHLT